MIDELSGKRIGFIGCGAMARALAGGLREAGVADSAMRAADLDAAQRRSFSDALGIKTTEGNIAVVEESEVVLLCVKPAAVGAVLAGLQDAGSADLTSPLWISIAAGITLRSLESALPAGARVIRTMPNTPALVGEGATALCAGAGATDADAATARAIFEAVGITWDAPSESLLDAVTGLAGSGPAYVFLILEALGDAGVRQGLPREAAHRLACQTVLGAARLAQLSDLHPAALKDQVTSPGGTTIAGLQALEDGGVRAALYAAVSAATARSKALAGD